MDKNTIKPKMLFIKKAIIMYKNDFPKQKDKQ